MSHLIPEVRLNKNGVPVTKHVRPDLGSGISKAPVPAPSLPDQRSLRIDMILEPMRQARSHSMLKRCKAFLEDWKESTIRAASDAIEANDHPAVAQVISHASYKRNEGFLLVVASTAEIWSKGEASYINDDGYMVDSDAQSVAEYTLWNTYMRMTPYDTTDSYERLSDSSASDFNEKESIEAFRLEYLGEKLGINEGIRTKREYYRHLEMIGDELDAVTEALPVIMKINSSIYVYDKLGNRITSSVNAADVVGIAKLAKAYPERIEFLPEFVKQRRSYDEQSATEFLSSSTPSLSAGLL